MTRLGYDSASEPTVAQIQAAVAAGASWWGFYLRGPGALHDWSPQGLANLVAGGIAEGLPIYVPSLTPTGQIASATPEADAAAFVQSCEALSVTGAGALDTEASMRGVPWTATYAQRFCAEVKTLGWKDVCYAGGFSSMTTPPPASFAWWIIASANPPAGTCYQAGQTTIAGLSVDVDYAGDGFPLASLTPEEDEDMKDFIANCPDLNSQFHARGELLIPLPSMADSQNLATALGLPVITVDKGYVQQWQAQQVRKLNLTVMGTEG